MTARAFLTRETIDLKSYIIESDIDLILELTRGYHLPYYLLLLLRELIRARSYYAVCADRKAGSLQGH